MKFFCPRWLLCVMVGTAPTAVTLRIWDVILVDSDRQPRDILRRCALAALELQVPFLLAAPGMGEAVEAIRSAGSSVDNVDAFLRKVSDTSRRDAAAAKAAAAAAAEAAVSERETRRAAASPGERASPPPARRGSAMKSTLKTPSRLKTLERVPVHLFAAAGPPPTALRPALTPFGNLLSMFQPTPRKTKTEAVKPRNLWGGGGNGTGENAAPGPAPTPVRTKSTPARWASSSAATGHDTVRSGAVLSPTYSNATTFRGVGPTTATKKRVDVESTTSSLFAAAEALGVTLIGHSVSFSSGVGANEVIPKGDGGSRGEGGDADGSDEGNCGIELKDFNAMTPRPSPGQCAGNPLRSPLGMLPSRDNNVASTIEHKTPNSRGGGLNVSGKTTATGVKRLITGTGPMVSWSSPAEDNNNSGGDCDGGGNRVQKVPGGGSNIAPRKFLGHWGSTAHTGATWCSADSPLRSPGMKGFARGAAAGMRSPQGFKSPMSVRSPVVKMR